PVANEPSLPHSHRDTEKSATRVLQFSGSDRFGAPLDRTEPHAPDDVASRVNQTPVNSKSRPGRRVGAEDARFRRHPAETCGRFLYMEVDGNFGITGAHQEHEILRRWIAARHERSVAENCSQNHLTSGFLSKQQ